MSGFRLALVIPPRGAYGFRDTGMKESLPHIGIAYLASNTGLPDENVRVFDCPAEKISFKGLVSRLREFQPDIVGFTGLTYQVDDAHTAARGIKQAFPGVTTIIGGYHVSAIPEETLNRYPEFDLAVYGEGEHTIKELLEALDGGAEAEQLSAIDGLGFRHRGVARVNQPREFEDRLDLFEFPGYDKMPMERYIGFYSLFMIPRRTVALSTGRGCPYKCIFCFKATGPKYRKRSMDSVMEEVRKDISHFGVRDIVITDESFMTHRARVHEFCNTILEEDLNRKMNWICQSRVDHAEIETIKLMKRAGCRVISFGVETGSPEILKNIHKGITREKVVEAVRMTREAGILTDTNFIIGHPGDTRETIEETIRFSKELDADMVSFAIMVPFPGTEIERMAHQGEGGLRVLTKDYSQFGKQVGGSLELEEIPRRELERYHRKAYTTFYLRPSKILHLLKGVDLRMLLFMGGHYIASLFRPAKRKPGRA